MTRASPSVVALAHGAIFYGIDGKASEYQEAGRNRRGEPRQPQLHTFRTLDAQETALLVIE